MAIEMTAHVEAAMKALRELAAGVRNTAVPNRQLATQLYSWTIRNYDSRGALQPRPWVPLAPATAKEKVRLGFSPEPLAPRTGNLRQSFAPFSSADEAGVGAQASVGVDYAAVHEYGTDKVPARPMLPTERVGYDYAVQVYTRYFEQQKKEAGL